MLSSTKAQVYQQIRRVVGTYVGFNLVEAKQQYGVEKELVVSNSGGEVLVFEQFVVVDAEPEVEVAQVLHETLVAEKDHYFNYYTPP